MSARRPIPLTPTLARIARGTGRRGFTLIEILIALAISMVIILTAISAFRVASRAISLANEMSTENGLLRIGFQASLEDVDFYHSDADDKPPYNKGFTRQRTLADATKADSHIRRHFQPLRFMASTDPDALPFAEPVDATKPGYNDAWDRVLNPNVMLAHDWRSIDRSFVFANTTPNGSYRFVKPTWVQGDYRLVACTDMRFYDGPVPAQVERRTPLLINQTFPYGTSARRAAFARDMDAKFAAYTPGPPETVMLDSELSADVLCPVRTVYNQAIPLLGWQVFGRLSFIGMTEYLSPGVNVFIQDQRGGEPGDGWQWGTKSFTSPKGFAQSGSGNRTSLPGVWWRSYRNASRDVASFLGCDFRESMTWAVVVQPVLGAPTGSDACYDRGACVLQMIMEGSTAGSGTARYWYGWSAGQDTGDVARNDRVYTSRTVRLPYNLTDQERAKVTSVTPGNAWYFAVPHYDEVPIDFGNKPAKYPVLTTTLLRYHRLGGTSGVTVATTTIEDQASGRRIELVTVPYGTTYRGARQHWRLYSPAVDQANAIGDFYDDAAGPFYAP